MDELMDRKEFDRGDAEVRQVVRHRRMGQAGVRAADLLGNIGMSLGEALHMGLVDHRLFERDTEALVAFPIEGAFGDDASGHGRGRIEIVEVVGLVEIVPEHRLAPGDVPVDGCRMGVEQELGGIAAQAVGRIPRAVHPQAVPLARADVGQESMPDVRCSFRQRDALLGSVPIEQAELDGIGHFGRHGDIETLRRGRGAQGKGAAGGWLHPYCLPDRGPNRSRKDDFYLPPSTRRSTVRATISSAMSRTLRFSRWDALTRTWKASSGVRPPAAIRMPTAWLIVSRVSMA